MATAVAEDIAMNADQVKGRLKTAKGAMKVITGKAVGDEHLADKGKTERVLGKIQTVYGDAKEDLESNE
jgi:uncharacterized protein YjbJ (UPF0337 family)